jgi:hypothetical protein
MKYNLNLPNMDYTKYEKQLFRRIFWYRLRKRLWLWFKISVMAVMLWYLLTVGLNSYDRIYYFFVS